MKKLRVMTFLMASIMLLCCCALHNDWHKEIIIVNDSDKEIVFVGGIAKFDNWPCDGIGIFAPPPIKPGSSFHMNEGHKFAGYEGVLKNERVVTIIIGDSETMRMYSHESCEVIRENVPILHRYELTLTDLQRMNWTVIYPPED